jgi:hypothetical protein
MLCTPRACALTLAGSAGVSAWPARQLSQHREKHHLITVEAPERRGELDAVRLGVTDFEVMPEDEDLPGDTSNGLLCKEWAIAGVDFVTVRRSTGFGLFLQFDKAGFSIGVTIDVG